jgi:galacturonosyltransferase
LVFHPAQKDPSPLVVIEALNAGLPIAVSLQTGNCPEAVEDGRNGFIFNAYEDEDIARAFEKIIRTPLEEREKMGQSSLGKAKINFDPEIVLSSFYENLLKLP